MERWRKHPMHAIEVSNLGHVRRNGRVKKLSRRSDGYLVTSVGGRRSPIRRVSMLVLETFRGPCPPGQETRHIDGDSSNNCLRNLKWGTRPQQVADQKRHGTFSPPPHYRGALNPAYRWSDKDYARALALINAGKSRRAAAKEVGMSKSQLLRRMRAMESQL